MAVTQSQFDLTEEQIRRYSRQIILKGVGGKGQKKLAQAKVLLVGAGGLGSPAGLYLAAAGVGTLGIVDSDEVDLSNLHRQILHRTQDLGKPKIESARRTMVEVNPDVMVVPYRERLSSGNIMEIIKEYDMVVDGSDNFETRYLVNDACVFARKPLSHGAVFGFDGQIMTIIPGESACYRCIFPEPPPPGLVPSCQEAGVLGVLPGVIGLLQATEAIKFILGKGDLLKGRMLVYNALEMSFREVKIPRNPHCPVCGEQPTITELLDYESHCRVRV